MEKKSYLKPYTRVLAIEQQPLMAASEGGDDPTSPAQVHRLNESSGFIYGGGGNGPAYSRSNGIEFI